MPQALWPSTLADRPAARVSSTPPTATPANAAIHVRPLRPDDADALRGFVATALGGASRRLRFHAGMHGCPASLLAQLMAVDGHRRAGLLAVVRADDGAEVVVGEAQVALSLASVEAEFGLSVADAWQGRGVGGLLLEAVEGVAARCGAATLAAEVLPGNAPMQGLLHRHGFGLEADDGDDLLGDAGAYRSIDAVQRWTRATPPAGPRRPGSGQRVGARARSGWRGAVVPWVARLEAGLAVLGGAVGAP